MKIKSKLEKMLHFFIPQEVAPELIIKLKPQVEDRLRNLCIFTGQRYDIKEVLNVALSLYDASIEHVADGGKIIFRLNGQDEVLSPESLGFQNQNITK